jgi:hypothetical protein
MCKSVFKKILVTGEVPGQLAKEPRVSMSPITTSTSPVLAMVAETKPASSAVVQEAGFNLQAAGLPALTGVGCLYNPLDADKLNHRCEGAILMIPPKNWC